MMKKVKIEDSIGMVLAHDLTRIVPGEFKGAAFKKGHVVKEEDLDILRSMGKNHIYILEIGENDIHENEAAHMIANAALGDGIYLKGPSEGKINFLSSERGLLNINVNALEKINEIEDVVLATMHNNSLVDGDKIVAATKIIPLITNKDKIKDIENICMEYGSIVSLKPIKSYKIGIVITGNEVYEGIIEDRFAPLLKDKSHEYGCEIVDIKYSKDDFEMISSSINSLLDMGCEIIITSGGMSVDPDDITPSVIKSIADEVVTYGSPVIPGAMFMLAYRGEVPIIGLPACGMYFKVTVFDLVFKRIIAGDRLVKKDLASLAHGGLCQNCEVCHYPICPFGK